MSYIRDTESLLDIANSIRFVTAYAETVTEEAFSVERIIQNVIIRELTVIGEAVRRLSTAFVEQHPELPFRDIIATRNALIHDYDDLILPEIWDTVKINLPQLLRLIEPLLPPEYYSR